MKKKIDKQKYMDRIKVMKAITEYVLKYGKDDLVEKIDIIDIHFNEIKERNKNE